MKKIGNINFTIVFALVAVVGIIVTIAASLNPYEKDISMIRNGAVEYNTGWELKNNRVNTYDFCNLPLNLNKEAYIDMTVRKLLGSESRDGAYLMFRTKHAEVHVSVNGKEIYSYGDMMSPVFPLPGSAWILIPLHDSYEGKYLSIDLHRIEAKYGGIMEQVIIGDRGDMIERLLTDNIFEIICCFAIGVVSVIMLVAAFAEIRIVHRFTLLHLTVFTVVAFIWSANETHCTQLFFGNMETVSILTYEAIAFLPMPLLSYYKGSRHKKVCEIAQRVSIIPVINFALMNGLHFLGVFDMSELLIITHITLVIVIGAVCIANFRSGIIKGRREEGALPEFGAIGFVILAISIIIDIVNYYMSSFVDVSRYSRIGLLLFILMLALDTIHNAIVEELNIKKVDIYKTVAFTDSLTGLGNRQAYEQEIEKINAREELLDHLVVGILDMNNLKHTNDSLGHAEGDRYIITISGFIQNYFGKIGGIYRIGGDEFAVLFTGRDSDIYFETEANMFDDIMRSSRQDINFAYGSAIYNHITDKSAGDTIRRAEAKMYDSKHKYKHKSGGL